jgi:uncharacterized protein with FMN-binding domain
MYQFTSNKNRGAAKGVVAGIGAVVIIIIVAVVAAVSGKTTTSDQNVATTTTPTTPVTSTTTPATPVDGTQTSKYKDGTYTSEGSYNSPGGPDKVKVTLTLQNDVVTALTFTPEPGDPTSSRYQGIFAAGINQIVVGMNIDQLNVTKVSGSSLTSTGFNDAVAQIKAQAQA